LGEETGRAISVSSSNKLSPEFVSDPILKGEVFYRGLADLIRNGPQLKVCTLYPKGIKPEEHKQDHERYDQYSRYRKYRSALNASVSRHKPPH
jgi:hypothetical protein